MAKSHALDIELELYARMKPVGGDPVENAGDIPELALATVTVPVYFGACGEPDDNGDVHIPVTVDASVFERMGALLDGRL